MVVARTVPYSYLASTRTVLIVTLGKYEYDLPGPTSTVLYEYLADGPTVLRVLYRTVSYPRSTYSKSTVLTHMVKLLVRYCAPSRSAFRINQCLFSRMMNRSTKY